MKARAVGRSLVIKRGRHLSSRISSIPSPGASPAGALARVGSDIQDLSSDRRSSAPPARSLSSRPPCPTFDLSPRPAEVVSLTALAQASSSQQRESGTEFAPAVARESRESTAPVASDRPTLREPAVARMPEQAPLEAVETTGIAAEAELGAEPELAALEHEPFEASREEAGDDANDDAHDDHDAHDDDAHDNAEAEVSDEPSPSLEAKLRRLDAGFRAPTHARRPDPEAHDDVDEDPFHGAPAAAETPRRRRIRAIVGVSVGLVALVSAGAVAAAALRGADHSESSAELAGAPAVVAAPPETRPPLAAEGRGSELAAARAITEAPATDPVPSPSAATSDPAKVKAQNRELFEHTKSLLIAGKLDEAVTSSEKLIAADPESALGYLCLGSAYQDLRRMSDARAAYSDCVAHAKNGPVDECAALGGRKR